MGTCFGRHHYGDWGRPYRSHPSSYPVTYQSKYSSGYYPDDEYYLHGSYGRQGVHYLHENRPHYGVGYPSVTYQSGVGGYYDDYRDDYRGGYY